VLRRLLSLGDSLKESLHDNLHGHDIIALMNYRRGLQMVLLLALIVASVCAQTPKEQSATPSHQESDTWERSRECATQADKVMADKKQEDQRAQEADPSDTRSHEWINHYSPKFDKCFIRDRQIHFEDKYLVDTVELIDAFERSILASRRASGSALSCQIRGGTAGCDSWNQFVIDHMQNQEVDHLKETSAIIGAG
jgi:hypothetical protein